MTSPTSPSASPKLVFLIGGRSHIQVAPSSGREIDEAARPQHVDLVGEREGRFSRRLDRGGERDAGAVEVIGDAAVVALDEALGVGAHVAAGLVARIDE